jgi:hypothetical protein
VAKQRCDKVIEYAAEWIRRRGEERQGVEPVSSLDFLFFAEAASVLPNHSHLFPTKTSVLDRPAEERVFVLLVVGGKGVSVEQHQFGVIGAHFRELRKILSNRSDQAGLSLHAFVIGHLAMRIGDAESARIPQREMARRLTSPAFC